VGLGGAVVDAEGADVAEEAGDDRVVGDAEPAEDRRRAGATKMLIFALERFT